MVAITTDIHSKGKGPAAKLSNFYDHGGFWFDGVWCLCLEGPLQAGKTPDIEAQIYMCGLSGREAKKYGEQFDEEWKDRGTLFWQSREFERQGETYQKHVDRLIEVALHIKSLRDALERTGGGQITHTIGKDDPMDTILTVDELCSRYMRQYKKLFLLR